MIESTFTLEDKYKDLNWMLNEVEYWDSISPACYKAVLAYWFNRWNFEDGNPDCKLVYDAIRILWERQEKRFVKVTLVN